MDTEQAVIEAATKTDKPLKQIIKELGQGLNYKQIGLICKRHGIDLTDRNARVRKLCSRKRRAAEGTYHELTYPLPAAVLADVDATKLSIHDIAVKHCVREWELRRIIHDHYDIDLTQRGHKVNAHRQIQSQRTAEQKASELEQAIVHALDTTTDSTVKIRRRFKCSQRVFAEIIKRTHYDTAERGRFIRAENKSHKQSSSDPSDQPLCEISREWLGKPWRTTQ